jgi:hypothetical protein
MDAKTAFKFGFLRRCAERGLSPEETEKVAEEAAAAVKSEEFWSLQSAVKEAGWWPNLKGVKDLAAFGLGLPLKFTFMAAPAVGAAAGYAHSRLTDIDEEDVEELKRRELAQLYREKARQLQLAMESQRGVSQVSQ